MELQSGEKGLDSGTGSGSDLEPMYSVGFDIICADLEAKHHDYQLFYEKIAGMNGRTLVSVDMDSEIGSTLSNMLHFLREQLNIGGPMPGPPSLESLARKQVIEKLGYSYMCILEGECGNENEVKYAHLVKDVIIDCMRVFNYMFGVKRLDNVYDFVRRKHEYFGNPYGEAFHVCDYFILRMSDDIEPGGRGAEYIDVAVMTGFLYNLFRIASIRLRSLDFYYSVMSELWRAHTTLIKPFCEYYNDLRVRGTGLFITDVERFFVEIIGPYLTRSGPAYARLANVCMRRGKFVRYAKYCDMFCEICNEAAHNRRDAIGYFFQWRELYETGQLHELFGRQ